MILFIISLVFLFFNLSAFFFVIYSLKFSILSGKVNIQWGYYLMPLGYFTILSPFLLIFKMLVSFNKQILFDKLIDYVSFFALLFSFISLFILSVLFGYTERKSMKLNFGVFLAISTCLELVILFLVKILKTKKLRIIFNLIFPIVILIFTFLQITVSYFL